MAASGAVSKTQSAAGRGLRAGIVINVAFAVGTAVAVLGVTRLSTSLLAPIALGLFLAARRYSASVSALANLGGPLFQIRYMGMHHDDAQLGDLITLFVSAVFAIVALLLAVVGLVARPAIAATILPANAYPRWFLPVVIALSVVQLFHFSVQNHLLVRRRILTYNMYKFLAATGLLFPALLVVERGSVRDVLGFYVMASLVLVLIGQTATTIRSLVGWRALPWARMPWILREAIAYGPPRAIVNFLDSLLFVLPAWLLRDNVAEAGFLLTMFVFIQATGIVILPINELVMVASAAHVGAGDQARLERTTVVLFELLLVVSCALVAVAFPFREALYRTAIGSAQVVAGVAPYSMLLSCIVPVTVFGGLKGVIDMRWREPRNLLNLAVSQATAVVVFYALRMRAWDERSAVIAASAIGFWLLGAMTVVALRSLLGTLDWARVLSAAIVIALGALAHVLLARWLSQAAVSPLLQFGIMLTGGGACASIAARTVDPLVWQEAMLGLRRAGAVAAGVVRMGGNR